MSWLDQLGDCIDELRRAGELQQGGRSGAALTRLDSVGVSADILGAAEPARLRSICHASAGDHAAAHAADRYAFRLATQRIDRLRDGFLDGVAAPRFAGDEFVVVLPGAGPTQAADVSRRISAAAAGENWQTLVPGTPIGLATGWSEIGALGRTLRAALAAAAASRTPA